MIKIQIIEICNLYRFLLFEIPLKYSLVEHFTIKSDLGQCSEKNSKMFTGV